MTLTPLVRPTVLTHPPSVQQHLQEILDLDMSALDWMMKHFPAIKEREDMRRIVGRYGLTGMQQVGTLSL